MITIIDYGLGNLASIKNMIKKVGGIAEITADLNKINKAKKIILPGVGAFAKGMENLINSGIKVVLDEKAIKEKVPIMGICLGMQLFTRYSEEGNVNGLGWINAYTKKFSFDTSIYKIPHMGWTDVKITQSQHPIFKNVSLNPRYYFVHSYYVSCEDSKNSIASSDYGITFDCGVVNDNILGFQFHPEKSHKFGMQIMNNFIYNL